MVVQMERMGRELCPLHGRGEDHAHVSHHRLFLPLIFNVVLRALGLVSGGTNRAKTRRTFTFNRPSVMGKA